MPELVHVADRVLVLRNGRVAATLDGSRNSEENILGAAMLEGEAA
jgi:ribose transport system ATP-binding protein